MAPPQANAALRRRIPLTAIQEFLKLESSGGIILVAMLLLALGIVNSPLGWAYAAVLNLPVVVGVGSFQIAKPLILWINDGLMVIFFLLVALEIKREMVTGELSSPRQIALPTFAALGGMALPALIYVAVNQNDPAALRGWAIPSATDIAFSLGVLSLLGRRVPLSLRVFLAALAILDDLGAIVIIAFFYTADLSLGFLALSAVALAGLFVLNRMGVIRLTPYVLIGLFLWVCVLKSGVHATLAGVALGLAIPLKVRNGGEDSPLRRVEHALHPWVAYAILPIFALANSGLPFAGITLETLTHPLFLGIALGLFVGKQVGVFVFSWLIIRFRLARLPEGATWAQFYGVSILTGIGFTMSLFIGSLAFGDSAGSAEVRLGVLLGSMMSALVGYLLLSATSPRPAPVETMEPRLRTGAAE